VPSGRFAARRGPRKWRDAEPGLLLESLREHEVRMNNGKTPKPSNQEQADRERELRDLIERVESETSGSAPPENESPHDFVERKKREQSKPDKS
jgi:hypothetical protein